ncbi:MAG: hypothetical protein OEO84_12855 [Betaproteobacteria bacterium]|nr:hypothetical protein [Betaproteobacteria bacterium]
MTPTLKPDSNREHPIVAWASILAVAIAMLVILWARFEVHGTQDLEEALSQEQPAPATKVLKPSPEADRSPREKEVEDAVATGRWATGFSP